MNFFLFLFFIYTDKCLLGTLYVRADAYDTTRQNVIGIDGRLFFRFFFYERPRKILTLRNPSVSRSRHRYVELQCFEFIRKCVARVYLKALRDNNDDLSTYLYTYTTVIRVQDALEKIRSKITIWIRDGPSKSTRFVMWTTIMTMVKMSLDRYTCVFIIPQ